MLKHVVMWKLKSFAEGSLARQQRNPFDLHSAVGALHTVHLNHDGSQQGTPW